MSMLFLNCRLPVPVISVGNLTWGGNGKTPMVEYIALKLHKAGILPLILTRVRFCRDNMGTSSAVVAFDFYKF